MRNLNSSQERFSLSIYSPTVAGENSIIAPANLRSYSFSIKSLDNLSIVILFLNIIDFLLRLNILGNIPKSSVIP